MANLIGWNFSIASIEAKKTFIGLAPGEDFLILYYLFYMFTSFVLMVLLDTSGDMTLMYNSTTVKGFYDDFELPHTIEVFGAIIKMKRLIKALM